MRWIIGDIHGMFKPLEALVSAIERHDNARQLIFVGDYVNRGPDSKSVIDFLLTLHDAHFLRGNHDDVFDQVLSGQSVCGEPGDDNRVANFQWFMQHGLDKTLASYGISDSEMKRVLRKPSAEAIDFLVEPVPRAHREFVRKLPLVQESDDMFVAHAKWDIYTPCHDPAIADRASKQSVQYSLLWGRYRRDEIEAEKPWSKVGYFGHTPVDTYVDHDEMLPIAGPKIILLDTAVALLEHGRLTAFCHEAGSFIQSDRQGKMVPAP